MLDRRFVITHGFGVDVVVLDEFLPHGVVRSARNARSFSVVLAADLRTDFKHILLELVQFEGQQQVRIVRGLRCVLLDKVVHLFPRKVVRRTRALTIRPSVVRLWLDFTHAQADVVYA